MFQGSTLHMHLAFLGFMGEGQEEAKAHQRPQRIGTGPDPHVGLATYLVRGLVKDGVVVINVHNFQVDRNLSCAGWGPIVGGPHCEVKPVYLFVVHCPVGNNLP